MALMLETCNVMVIQVIMCLGGSETDNIRWKYHLSGAKLGGDRGGREGKKTNVKMLTG